MKPSVQTLDEYMQDCRIFALKILELDKHAPAIANIDKICTIMSSELHMDKCEYEKQICFIMEKRRVDFSTARNIIRQCAEKS